MYFVIAGVALLIMKIAEFGPVGAWPWWGILLPFGLAVAWWAWADGTGFTKRREMDKMEAKKRQRRIDNLDALGMDAKGRRGRSDTAKARRRL
ncbi:TIGR04438 family Trp-rich protein [Piscinibacter sp. XHJ-5]|uniref:TIGR04438 family Trp-rich protein n=1 Tax=Piscinibacter sp. XHJ-5 TaxID=3037797 RepID=UPI0024535DA0|nr:TIGR04438 family Trp-rich protein [Piscinibacter sp. XHJ-5]